MTKKEYWEAHVKRNPTFADESKTIQITVGMLHKLLDEAFDKGIQDQADAHKAARKLIDKAGLNTDLFGDFFGRGRR